MQAALKRGLDRALFPGALHPGDAPCSADHREGQKYDRSAREREAAVAASRRSRCAANGCRSRAGPSARCRRRTLAAGIQLAVDQKLLAACIGCSELRLAGWSNCELRRKLQAPTR